MIVALEGQARLLDFTLALNVNFLRPIDHDFSDRLVGQQRLQRAKAQNFGNDLFEETLSLLAGQDDGANPVEHLLNALAACVTTSMVAHAAVRGIHIEALESELEADIDLRGFLGLDEDVPKGFTDIRVKFRVKSDVRNMDRLKRLTAFSPVFNTITQGANVDIQVDVL